MHCHSKTRFTGRLFVQLVSVLLCVWLSIGQEPAMVCFWVESNPLRWTLKCEWLCLLTFILVTVSSCITSVSLQSLSLKHAMPVFLLSSKNVQQLSLRCLLLCCMSTQVTAHQLVHHFFVALQTWLSTSASTSTSVNVASSASSSVYAAPP